MEYNIGDSVRFDVSFDYQGPYYTGAKLKCAVGIKGVFFDEKCKTEISLILPETMAWDRFTQRVLVTLKGVKMGEVYDTEVRLMPNIWGQPALEWDGAQNIQMGALAPDFEFRNLTVRVG